MMVDDNPCRFLPKVTERDLERIGSLDWLMVDGVNELQAAMQVNALARCFLLQRNVEAARMALAKLPSRVAEVLSPNSRRGARLDHTAAIYTQDEKHLNEYEGLSALAVSIN
jgi:hypothetical protein